MKFFLEYLISPIIAGILGIFFTIITNYLTKKNSTSRWPKIANIIKKNKFELPPVYKKFIKEIIELDLMEDQWRFIWKDLKFYIKISKWLKQKSTIKFEDINSVNGLNYKLTFRSLNGDLPEVFSNLDLFIQSTTPKRMLNQYDYFEKLLRNTYVQIDFFYNFSNQTIVTIGENSKKNLDTICRHYTSKSIAKVKFVLGAWFSDQRKKASQLAKKQLQEIDSKF